MSGFPGTDLQTCGRPSDHYEPKVHAEDNVPLAPVASSAKYVSADSPAVASAGFSATGAQIGTERQSTSDNR